MTSGGSEPPPSPTRAAGALRAIEHASVWVERPVRRLAGGHRFNPLPHAGTISVFLLGVVIVSGLYITLFFEFGYAASYDSVAAMEDHAIQRVVRALHRYSSAMLVVTTLVHAWRILASGRYTARRRRWRWLTGVASLVLVWLAGVTGYWLVWDRRAAALNEATAGLLRSFDSGTRFAIRNLIGVSPGSGSDLLLFIWFVHLALTGVIGWFVYRHLRHSKQAWLPSRWWMGVMGGGLVAASLVLPVGMLGPARPDQLVAEMPLDPFVMFLLPPLLSSYNWVTIGIGGVVIAAALAFPRLVARRDPEPVVIDLDACTGCSLCVVDCPYDALEMTPAGSARADRSVAVLDPSRCVACGICVGSCAFDAIGLPGASTPDVDAAGKAVVVVCDRHLDADRSFDESDDEQTVVVAVRCAGMFEPNAVRDLTERGANGVQLVGCAVDDCRYGVGNRLADERLRGDRAPHPPRRFADRITSDWVDTAELGVALAAPGTTEGFGRSDDAGLRARLLSGSTLLIALSIVIVVFATRAPFRRDESQGAVRVVVDHEHGQTLQETDAATGPIDWVELRLDGDLVERSTIAADGGESIGLVDWDIAPGDHEIDVVVGSESGATLLFGEEVTIEPLQRLVLTATDVPEPPGAAEGRAVFNSRSAACQVCHSVRPDDDGVGPTLYGIGSTAATRVEGLSAEQYLRQSILLPDQYVVPGWPAGQMLPIYRERLSETELSALIEYLLTLDEDAG